MSASDWSFADALAWTCSRNADQTAWLQDDRSVTYAELWSDVERLASAVSEATTEGSRFGILARNSHHYLAAFGAAALSRRVAVPLNDRLTAVEQQDILSDSDCRLLLTDDTKREFAVGLAEDAGIHVISLDACGSSVANGDEPTEGDLAALMYTAAVDGRARGAMMTQRSFSFQMANMAGALGLRPSDRVAIFTPLCHAAALTYALATLHAGAACVCLAGFDGRLAASVIDEHRVTVLPAFAPMPRLILDAAEETGFSLLSLKTVIARDSVDTMRAFFEVSPSLEWRIGNFGQTETQGMAVVGTPVLRSDLADEAWSPPGGRPMPMTRVRVVDAHDGDVPRGEIGEIVVKGPNTAAGYWQRDPESRAALRGGWWHTGDLGRFDETGALHFSGRTAEKDLIKTGGENVYPDEVEEVLRRHPGVRDAVVIGIADPVWTESVKAVVALEPGAAVTVEELIRFCQASIASYKKPRVIAFVDDLPSAPDKQTARELVRRSFGDSGVRASGAANG